MSFKYGFYNMFFWYFPLLLILGFVSIILFWQPPSPRLMNPGQALVANEPKSNDPVRPIKHSSPGVPTRVQQGWIIKREMSTAIFFKLLYFIISRVELIMFYCNGAWNFSFLQPSCVSDIFNQQSRSGFCFCFIFIYPPIILCSLFMKERDLRGFSIPSPPPA